VQGGEKDRKLITGLIAIIIVLAAGLGVLIYDLMSYHNAYSDLYNKYMDLRDRYQDLNETYNSLYSNFLRYKSDHHYSDYQYEQLYNQYQDLENQYRNLEAEYNFYIQHHHHTDDEFEYYYEIATLQKSKTLVSGKTISQPASSYTYWIFDVYYPGYIMVYVETSTSDNTYVEVIWNAYGVHYDERIVVGSSGAAYFPVLPTDNLEVRIGNTNWVNGATETVTIIYYY